MTPNPCIEPPLRHLSVRVPWHDSGWTGCVCKRPAENVSCLALDRISTSRDDDRETQCNGRYFSDLKPDLLPPCVAERSFFMAEHEWSRTISHPYSITSELHTHIRPTEMRYPRYSAAAVPFRRMLKSNAPEIAEKYGIEYHEKREYENKKMFPTQWVQAIENQEALLNSFFKALHPQKSLCFFYAKRTPLADDNRRVIIGVGRIESISPPREYDYSPSKSSNAAIRSLIWDRPVQHSIRPGGVDGFLLPYHELLEVLERNPELDPSAYVAFVPYEHHSEFSYASEHVTHDAAISALIACKIALERASNILDNQCGKATQWIDERLSELWNMRGPFPGLGSALCAYGIAHGNFLAYELAVHLKENEDPWTLVHKAFQDPHAVSDLCATYIDRTSQKKWQRLPEERKELLKLISRFDMNNGQAKRFYVKEERIQAHITGEDADFLKNPYLLYERDRFSPDPISLSTIDKGMCPPGAIENISPLSDEAALEGPADIRRVSALMISVLEHQAECGNTLLPQRQMVTEVRNLPLDPPCPVDGEHLDIFGEELSPSLVTSKIDDSTITYKLKEIDHMSAIIRKTVEKRIVPHRNTIPDTNWRELLVASFTRKGIVPDTDDIQGQESIDEKAAVLEMLAASRFAVVLGAAGTGKTTLLSVFCNHEPIKNGGVLLLAPTGKARVRLQQETGLDSRTIAQFLLPLKRYDETTGRYRTSSHHKYDRAKTVIIDEASMLTEDQLGAIFDALESPARYILVGDPHQLPPIGAGRPFVDIIARLQPADITMRFPRVAPSFAELTRRSRQKGTEPVDVQLAELFSGREPEPGGDEIFDSLSPQVRQDRIRLVEWNTKDEIREKLLDVLKDELGLTSYNDSARFELSLGGRKYKDNVYFNTGTAASAEKWQILSPLRGTSCGIMEINRFIQTTYRAHTLRLANDRKKLIPRPMGPDRIVYGDKVICTINNSRTEIYPSDTKALKYVANGEIGMAVGMFRSPKVHWNGALPLNVEFASQQGYIYSYKKDRDFSEEASPHLELAYAITIHRSQGSEFDLTILIVPNPCRLLSRELLYTALTRQKDRIVILHQGSFSRLRDYTSDYHSDTARRITDLFQAPHIVEIKDRFFEENLIHRTRTGIAVRSKSEVIIANELSAHNITFGYEKPFRGNDGCTRWPDFTIHDEDTGSTYFWEHLGMLSDNNYAQKWEQKREWYRRQNVLPLEEGGGQAGTLIETRDTPDGGIDAEEICSLIERIL